MVDELFFRTEDIRRDEVLDYLVETSADREVVEHLKGRSPIVLRGSRGVGKSFLLRVAEVELLQNIDRNRVLPVYITFARASLIKDPTPERFLAWMMAKICNQIVRTATANGYVLPSGSSVISLAGGPGESSKLEAIERQLEDSWKSTSVDHGSNLNQYTDPDMIKMGVEDLCETANLTRIVLLVDEAAHVFIPEQQRQFFTLMRDLRSPYLAIKAAVYPGATAFGDFFQPSHDSTLLSIDRNVMDEQYTSSMREIVFKQDLSLRKAVETNGDVFDTLAYASTGNPRILLKTFDRSRPFARRRAQDTIREYYREEIWAEHSSLAERYPGHRDLIDWGRRFLESDVLPELYSRNQGRTKETSSAIWIHRDAPQAVREALRLLCYGGILQEGVSGIRATRSEVGTRYMVNLGCQFALDRDPVSYGSNLRRTLSIKRMIEFGANHRSFQSIKRFAVDQLSSGTNLALEARLDADSSTLDLTDFQMEKIRELKLRTIRDVLAADEGRFMKARWVGEKRARRMMNAAVAAVLEYLSG